MFSYLNKVSLTSIINMIENIKIKGFQVLFLIFLFGCGQDNNTQVTNNEPYTLKGTINGYPNGRVLLHYELGGELILFDSIQTNTYGTFSYQLPEGFRQGICYASWGSNSDKRVRFVTDNENITFQTTNTYNPDVTFTLSPYSSALQKYTDEKNVFFERLRVLGPVLSNYTPEEDYYQVTKNEFIKIQVEYSEMIDDMIGSDTVSFLAQYIKSDRLPKLNPLLNMDEQNRWFYEHWFDHVDFSNSLLINSNLFGEKIFYHLTLAQTIAKSFEHQIEMFKSSIDEVLNKSSVNNEVYGYCVSKLLSIFREAGDVEMVDYILESYHTNMECSDLNLPNKLQNEIMALEKIKIGASAPNIFGKTIEGDTLQLYEISSRYILVVFWSSSCPGCVDLLPKLNELDVSQNDYLDIFAYSVDAIENDWVEFVKENNINYNVVSGSYELTRSVLGNYVVTSTPSMFLLDEERKIISRPVNYFDLLKDINELGIAVKSKVF